MIDHLDTQTNDFLENGTTFSAIFTRHTQGDPDRDRSRHTAENDFMSPEDAAYNRPVIDMDDWGSTPVTTVLYFADSVEELGQEEYRATAPDKASRGNGGNRLEVIKTAAINVEAKK